MLGDGWDPCECVFNHESSMRRLLNILRQSQAYCNDVVCHEDPTNQLANQGNGEISIMYGLLLVWLLITTGVFAFRAVRPGADNVPKKPRPSGGNDQEPPAVS
ncbi:unnamed protein product [Mesocestoides corti]|uniref:Small integral membrane protein 14 n=1 Tax=Mesocestoides corti TaxID=53468 RepID=A0A0R3UN34_MESCO|nr:unnamed protein product [Mesocestoides corti]